MIVQVVYLGIGDACSAAVGGCGHLDCSRGVRIDVYPHNLPLHTTSRVSKFYKQLLSSAHQIITDRSSDDLGIKISHLGRSVTVS